MNKACFHNECRDPNCLCFCHGDFPDDIKRAYDDLSQRVKTLEGKVDAMVLAQQMLAAARREALGLGRKNR